MADAAAANAAALSEARSHESQMQLDPSTLSALCASHAVQTIVDRGAEVLYERYLASKENDFVVQRTIESLKHLIEWQLPDIDAPEHRGPEYQHLPSVSAAGLWECEPEPIPAPLESWARSAVPTKLPLMRRREILQARRAASLHHEQQRAHEAAQAAAEEQMRQQTGARPGTVTTRPGTVGSQLATITEGRDEGGDGRLSATGKIPASLSQNRRQVLATVDKKVRTEAEGQRKAEKMAKEANMRDKAMRKALDGKKFTVDERGGIIVVQDVDPASLGPVQRHVEAGVEGQDEAHGSRDKVPKHRNESMSSPGRSQGGSSVNQRLQRADQAERVSHDPRFRKEAATSQPSLLDSLSAAQDHTGSNEPFGLSMGSVGSTGRGLGLTPGVSVREAGRTISSLPVHSPGQDAHPSRRAVEARRQGASLSASSFAMDQGVGEMPSSFGTGGAYAIPLGGSFTGSLSGSAAQSQWIDDPRLAVDSSRAVGTSSTFRSGPVSPALSQNQTVRAGIVSVGGISLNASKGAPR